jgi:hypothetical protein
LPINMNETHNEFTTMVGWRAATAIVLYIEPTIAPIYLHFNDQHQKRTMP